MLSHMESKVDVDNYSSTYLELNFQTGQNKYRFLLVIIHTTSLYHQISIMSLMGRTLSLTKQNGQLSEQNGQPSVTEQNGQKY